MNDNDNLKMGTGSRTLTFNSNNIDKVLDHNGREWRPVISADGLEEAAEKAWYEMFQSGNTMPSFDEGFIAGAQNQDAIAVDRTVRQILLRLQSFSDQMYSDCPIGEVAAFDMIKLYKAKYHELGNIIEHLQDQITKLKKP